MKTDFTIYGVAVIDGVIRGIADRRVRKHDGGTISLRRRTLSTAWPDTARGTDAAKKWSAAVNRRVAARLAR